jgi:hypothetical protein
LGRPLSEPFSMKSKSSRRLNAARPTTNRLKAMPIGPDSWMYGMPRPPMNRLRSIETR